MPEETARPPQRSLVYNAAKRFGPLVEEETFARLCRSRDFLAATLDRPVHLDDAASAACLSPFHYHRQFARAFGETPHDFLMRVRMDRARELLARDELPVTEVCLAVGYESLGSFSTRFRAMVGCSPSAYRRSIRRLFPAPAMAIYRYVPSCYLLHYGARPF